MAEKKDPKVGKLVMVLRRYFGMDVAAMKAEWPRLSPKDCLDYALMLGGEGYDVTDLAKIRATASA